MTGPGSATVAWVAEDSMYVQPETPTWRQTGMDIVVNDASLDRALERARQPDSPRPQGSREGNREGALGITFSQTTQQNWHELAFPESTNTALASSSQLAPTATFYLSADIPGNTQDRFLIGAAIESVTWNYNQGQKNTVDWTIVYGDEREQLYNADDTTVTTVTPSSQEVGVQTDSLDTGFIVLYDGSGDPLDRVEANSSAYENTTTVNGTAIESVRIIDAGSAVTNETVTINDEPGGSGTDTTVDVTTSELTVSSFSQPNKDDIVTFAETDYQIDSLSVEKLQSLQLTIAGMSTFRRGQQQRAVDAVVDAYQPSLSVNAIIEDGTRRELAYGSSGASRPVQTVDQTDTTLIFDTASDLNVNGVQPTSYSWENLVSTGEEQLQDPTEFHVANVSVV